MDVSKLIVLGVALIAGGGAFFLIMNNQQDGQSTVQIVKPVEEKTVRILVADQDFQRGQRLGVETVKWVKWPEKALSESYITEDSGASIEDLENAVARSLIVLGEPIIEGKIVRAGSAGLLAAVLQPGMRAVTMRVNPETSAGGFILPGDRVDILYAEGNDDDETEIRTLLQDVRVLAVDAIYSESPESPNIAGSNVTIELSPGDSEFFLQARASRGELSLTLRSIFESDTENSARRNTTIDIVRYGRS